MEALISNRRAARRTRGRFDVRLDQCVTRATKVRIATGYVSVEGIAHLTNHVRTHPASFESFVLWIGMGGPGDLVRRNAATVLNEELLNHGLGRVYVVKKLNYHGKIYLFGDSDGLFSGIVGSSNLPDPKNHPRVEIDLFLDKRDVRTKDPHSSREALALLERYLTGTLARASISIEEYNTRAESGEEEEGPGAFDFYADIAEEELSVFEGVIEGFRRVSGTELADVRKQLATEKFWHQLKTADGWSGQPPTKKSNLNSYHGKPRLRRHRDGDFLVPRPWYEIEIILSEDERLDPNCPPPGDFKVITDDGWSFDCRRQGDYGKNIRSTGTLLVLGKWLKGRLERSGALRVGDLVTKQALLDYGRDGISLTRIEDGTGRWYLDFSRPL